VTIPYIEQEAVQLAIVDMAAEESKSEAVISSDNEIQLVAKEIPKR
jgi:hypothetical protein